MSAVSCPLATRRWSSCIARSFHQVLACSSIPGFEQLCSRREASCLPHPEPAPGTLRWELRQDLLVEPCQLSCLVLYRPQEDLSDPGCLELDQFFSALGRGSNE